MPLASSVAQPLFDTWTTYWAGHYSLSVFVEDFDGDGNSDILIAGNFYASEVETGRADAGNGLFMKGDGTGRFSPVHLTESGFYAPGDVRDIRLARGVKGWLVVVVNNDDKVQVFEVAGSHKPIADAR